MEVLILGMSRTLPPSQSYSLTCHTAMHTAFQLLGLKSMHMAQLRFTPPGTHYHGKGEEYGKVELDKLLGEYSVCCVHFPASVDYGEILLI